MENPHNNVIQNVVISGFLWNVWQIPPMSIFKHKRERCDSKSKRMNVCAFFLVIALVTPPTNSICLLTFAFCAGHMCAGTLFCCS